MAPASQAPTMTEGPADRRLAAGTRHPAGVAVRLPGRRESFHPYSRSGVLMCYRRLPLLEFDAVWFAAVSVINLSLA